MTDVTPASDPRSDALFEQLRPRLHGIAYRMLASRADAEDIVQDAWLRWNEANRAGIANAEAWLVTVTTRIAIDRLRAVKSQREHYVGFWLPEPLLTDAAPVVPDPIVAADAPATPEQIVERADDLSFAFLSLLERLAPEARAAFLLREVFDADYGEVAAAIGKSEAACRQIVHRARTQLRDARPRYAVPRSTHERLLRDFVQAAASGNFAALSGLLAEDAELIGDGGGKVPSFGKPLLGGERIAQLFYAAHLRHGDGQRIEMAAINGQWGVLRFIDGALESAQSFETDGERVRRIHVQRNPDKLAAIAAEWTAAGATFRPGVTTAPARSS